MTQEGQEYLDLQVKLKIATELHELKSNQGTEKAAGLDNGKTTSNRGSLPNGLPPIATNNGYANGTNDGSNFSSPAAANSGNNSPSTASFLPGSPAVSMPMVSATGVSFSYWLSTLQPVTPNRTEQSAAADPKLLSQTKLAEASDLTTQAYEALTDGKYLEALDKHQRASMLRVEAMGESHSVATENWHAMGQVYVQLGREYEAFHYLSKAYEIRRKKKNITELRWETGFMLAMVYRGSLRFQEALDFYKRCHAFYQTEYGDTDSRTVDALEQKKWCQKLQNEKWWLVDVSNALVGADIPGLKKRRGRIFPGLNDVIMMMTGEVYHTRGKHDYEYVMDKNSPDLPPELGGTAEKKSAAVMTDELVTMRKLKRKHPTESIQFYIDKFQELHPDVTMNKNKAKKLLKDLEKFESPMEKKHAEQVKQMTEELRQEILMKLRDELKVGNHMPECAICFEQYTSNLEACIIKKCGHTFCKNWYVCLHACVCVCVRARMSVSVQACQ
jgi:tetratricopeptide (TPR) repeat protein